MTNKELKQELFEKAYGKNWDVVKEYVNPEDGSLPNFLNFNEETDFFYTQLGYNSSDIEEIYDDMDIGSWRPKSLIGIEDNNGWTRIEPDGSNLPTDDLVKYKCYHKTNGIINYTDFMCENVRVNFFKKVITHYKVKEELKPLY